MTYRQAIEYLESFINYEKIPAWPYKESLKLKRFKEFLAAIGNPQHNLQCIHIAGSKGKGSTCAFITYILQAAGFKVGLFTSPHLSDFRERIRVLNPKPRIQNPESNFEGMIPKNDLARTIERLRPAIEKHNRASASGPLSFFEVYTALAFIYFKEKKVDFAVLETGLGGRLDATNTVDAMVSVITPISYEHIQKLGSTLREIAGEKAGIIKNRSPAHKPWPAPIVISAPQEKEAAQVIRKRCRQFRARLYEVETHINLAVGSGGTLTIKGVFARYHNLKIKLLGAHQRINAAVAVGAIDSLQSYGIAVEADDVRKGLCNAVWPGRCEAIAQKPWIVLDGAQNIASGAALKKAIKANFKYKKLVLVLGISKDKDIPGICRELRNLAGAVVLTRAQNPRAMEPSGLANYFYGKDIYIADAIPEALRQAKAIALKSDLILVTGSLFVVAEAREVIAKECQGI